VYWSCTENTRSNYCIQTPLSCFTETGCQSCCQDDPDCVGFDIDFNQFPAVCYMYTARELFASTYPENGVRHCSAVSQVCSTSTTTTGIDSLTRVILNMLTPEEEEENEIKR
jgi:hypothetical protein